MMTVMIISGEESWMCVNEQGTQQLLLKRCRNQQVMAVEVNGLGEQSISHIHVCDSGYLIDAYTNQPVMLDEYEF